MRETNLVWTVSEDYTIDLYDNHLAPYELALIGMGRKVFSGTHLHRFMELHRRYNNFDDLEAIALLVLDHTLRERLFAQRPGTRDFFDDYIRELRHHFDYVAPKNIAEELKRAYFHHELKGPRIATGTLDALLRDIEAVHITDTFELLSTLKRLYATYFHIYNTMPESDALKTVVQSAKTPKPSAFKTKVDAKTIDVADLEKFTIESAEFTSQLYDDIAVIKDEVSIKSAGKDYRDVVRRRYGKPTLSRHTLSKLEKELCIGIHDNVKLYFTDFVHDNPHSFYAERMAEVTASNRTYYDADRLHYTRAVTNLKEMLKQSLVKNADNYASSSTSGTLRADKVWKTLYTSDNKVFERQHYDDNGNITVDILLDASASQNVRTELIATEAYIIAEALSDLHIPTRVVGYNNFFDHMILKVYRDYHDVRQKNQEIFSFQTSGSNRDGLAVSLMRHLILNNHATRRFLIVLSDGKPNDETDLGLVGMSDLGVANYVDDDATYDAFNQVLRSRLEGIFTLGVFTGFDDDLETERKIFGADFAYITDIKRFHHIVGIFFKLIAERTLEMN
ncbi:hypothetical protein O6R05_02865 [Peptoniphilus equinus]|uniref:Nitric oxide reductase activation protein n=1 Tax=Peptoniphilus equinus TaxID=3016343 RepID=A0ABY7QUV6_9FIRM|nr:hypothetical protein [Peptoniphilus equinus]WBW50502.1 hypothetical protein O6R05_02865 [Peptoniphilus equinus]